MTDSDITRIEVRQCHSYNRSGERCEHPAGHTGKHFISVEWSDAEAWTPTPAGMAAAAAVVRLPPVQAFDGDIEHLTAGPDMDETCICEHARSSHSNGVGACAARDCDCRGFIG
jgi:hypothetical protein